MAWKILEKVKERRRRVEEIARKLESKSVAPKAARRLAKLVASGEYTIDEAVKAYRRTKSKRIKKLAESLESGSALFDRAPRLEASLWGSLGLDLDLSDLLGGPAPRRRRKG